MSCKFFQMSTGMMNSCEQYKYSNIIKQYEYLYHHQPINIKSGRWLSQRESLAWWRKLMSSPSSATVKSQVFFFHFFPIISSFSSPYPQSGVFFPIFIFNNSIFHLLLFSSVRCFFHFFIFNNLVFSSSSPLSQWSSSTPTTSCSSTPAQTWTE